MTRTRPLHSLALAAALLALAVPTASARQDLRSPDAQDAASNAAARPAQPSQDLRSPDARDAADASRVPEVTVVKVDESAPSSGGIDWGDAGIGAGGLLGLTLVSLGGMLVVKRRRSHGAVTTA
jgi:hypothetical protein